MKLELGTDYLSYSSVHGLNLTKEGFVVSKVFHIRRWGLTVGKTFTGFQRRVADVERADIAP